MQGDTKATVLSHPMSVSPSLFVCAAGLQPTVEQGFPPQPQRGMATSQKQFTFQYAWRFTSFEEEKSVCSNITTLFCK